MTNSNYTIQDIARMADVSTASVSRVINNDPKVSTPMRDRVLEVIRKVNYIPNNVAKSLKTNQTHTIGVIIPDISNEFFMEIVKQIENELRVINYNALYASGSGDKQREESLLQKFIEQRVEGLILALSWDHTELFNLIERIRIPTIMIDRHVPNQNNFIGIFEENYRNMLHLIEKIHSEHDIQSIGVITGPIEAYTSQERLKAIDGYYERQPIDRFDFHGDFSEKSGKQAFEYYRSLHVMPDCLYILNNNMTYGFIDEAIKYPNVFLPKVLGVYGDSFYYKLINFIKIYSIIQNPREIGQKAGSLIVDLVQDNELIEKNHIIVNNEFNWN